MKKLNYFIIPLFLFTALPLFALQSDFVDVQKLQGQLTETLQEEVNQPSLYSFVKQELSNYYGKDDFADPDRQTGWYRVDDFLKWVQNNEGELENSVVNTSGQAALLKSLLLENNYKKENFYNVFWVYLGARYIAYVYKVNLDFDKLRIHNACQTTSASVPMKEIYLCIEPEAALPYLINVGIHETTHLFLRLQVKTDANKKATNFDPLPELATFQATHNFGLPIKKDDSIEGKDGVRDILRTNALRPDVNTLKEYNAYLGGLMMPNITTKEELLSLVDNPLSSKKIAEVCFNLPAVIRNKFFIVDTFRHQTSLNNLDAEDIELLTKNKSKKVYLGQKYLKDKDSKEHMFAQWDEGSEYISVGFYEPITIRNYIKNIFGKYASPKINNFYINLYNRLPKEFIDEVNATFEIQTNRTYQDYDGENIVTKYEAQIKDAVVLTLKEMDVPKAKIPEDYI